MINRSFAAAFFGNDNPIGRSVTPGGNGPTFTVVGMVSDVRDFGPEQEAPPVAYFQFGNGPWRSFPNLTFAVRTDGAPTSFVPAIRGRIYDLDPNLPMANVQLLEDIVTEQLGAARRSAFFLLTARRLVRAMP